MSIDILDKLKTLNPDFKKTHVKVLPVSPSVSFYLATLGKN